MAASCFTAALIYAVLEEEGVDMEEIPRMYPQKADPFLLPNSVFISQFRLSKEAVRQLCFDLSPDLKKQRNTKTALTVEHQVLIALNFYGKGGFLDDIGKNEYLRASKSTISKTIHAVSEAIVKKLKYKISFPSTSVEKFQIKKKMYEIAGMPGCLGAIDGTYIAIQGPPSNSQFNHANYFCHKGYFGINTMIICDAYKKIIHIDATSAGANHDAFVFNHSLIKERSQDLFDEGEWLIGDSAYPQLPFLMTPVRNAVLGSAEEKYNNALCKTRVIIEQCIWMLKMRFRCLQRYRTLHFTPDKCSFIITACAILHNICLEQSVSVPTEYIDDDDVQSVSHVENTQLFNIAVKVKKHELN